LFNEIFKKVAEQIDKKLKGFYNAGVLTVTEIQTCLNYRCDLTDLYSDMLFSDVELEVEGKVLKAHKAILWGNLIWI
jgi:hypothetical protein